MFEVSEYDLETASPSPMGARCTDDGSKPRASRAARLLSVLAGAAALLLAPAARGQESAEPPAAPTANTEADADAGDAPDTEGTTSSETTEDGQGADDTTKPSPDAIADARVRYQRGLELYRSGDFKLALIEFQRSYEIAPNYRILFNVGQVNMQLNRYAKALQAFRRYLDEGGDAIEADRRDQIENELAMLMGRTATIHVTSNVEGATVQVDGVPVGTTPLTALLVDAGEHNVTVSTEGRSKSEYVVLAGKEDKTLTILVPLPTPAPTAAPPPPPSTIIVDNTREEQPVGVPVIVGWSLTGALTAAAIGTGVAALGAQNDLEDVRSGRTTQSELDDANRKATTLSITTDVLIGAAIVAGGVSLYLTLTDGDDEDASEPTTKLGVGPGSLQLMGTF